MVDIKIGPVVPLMSVCTNNWCEEITPQMKRYIVIFLPDKIKASDVTTYKEGRNHRE